MYIYKKQISLKIHSYYPLANTKLNYVPNYVSVTGFSSAQMVKIVLVQIKRDFGSAISKKWD